jgi:hypothetical protein
MNIRFKLEPKLDADVMKQLEALKEELLVSIRQNRGDSEVPKSIDELFFGKEISLNELISET